jgi:hypothetical protein
MTVEDMFAIQSDTQDSFAQRMTAFTLPLAKDHMDLITDETEKEKA